MPLTVTNENNPPVFPRELIRCLPGFFVVVVVYILREGFFISNVSGKVAMNFDEKEKVKSC